MLLAQSFASFSSGSVSGSFGPCQIKEVQTVFSLSKAPYSNVQTHDYVFLLLCSFVYFSKRFTHIRKFTISIPLQSFLDFGLSFFPSLR